MPNVPHPRVRNPNKKSPTEVFDEMRKNFDPDKAKGLHLAYQWKLSGSGGGEWNIKIDDGKCSINKGEISKADVTFECSADTWVALSNQKLSGTMAFMRGMLHVKGSHSTAKKLDTIFPA